MARLGGLGDVGFAEEAKELVAVHSVLAVVAGAPLSASGTEGPLVADDVADLPLCEGLRLDGISLPEVPGRDQPTEAEGRMPGTYSRGDAGRPCSVRRIPFLSLAKREGCRCLTIPYWPLPQ